MNEIYGYEYPEFAEFKKNVDEVTIKFIELERSWRRTEKGSGGYFVTGNLEISLLISSEFKQIS